MDVATLTGPFTFTSPTVYLAYGSVVAFNICSTKAKYSGGVVPIKHPERLRSARYTMDSETWTGDQIEWARAQSRNPYASDPPDWHHQWIFIRESYRPDVETHLAGYLIDRVMYTFSLTSAIPLFTRTWRYSTYPINFAHFQEPIPAALYFRQAIDCHTWDHYHGDCGTITYDRYHPPIDVPSELR